MSMSKRIAELGLDDAKEIAKLYSYCCSIALKLGFSKMNLAAALEAFVEQLKTTEKPLEYFADFDHSRSTFSEQQLKDLKEKVNSISDWTEL